MTDNVRLLLAAGCRTFVLSVCGASLALAANGSEPGQVHIVTLDDVLTAADEPSGTSGISGIRDLAWIGASSLAYVLTDGGVSKAYVETFDADRRTRRRISEGVAPKGSPDGRRLAFIAPDAGQSPQLWTFAMSSGVPRQLTRFPDDFLASGRADYEYAWSPDGKHILLARHVGLRSGRSRGHDWIDRPDPGGPTAVVFDGKTDPATQLRKTELWLVDSSSGESRLVYTDPTLRIDGIGWFPDNRRVAYLRYGYPTAKGLVMSISILDTVSGVARTLVDNVGQRARPFISPNGRYLAFDHDTLGIVYPYHHTATIVDVETGTTTPLDIPGAESRVITWHPDGRGIYARVKDDTATTFHIESVSISGERQILPEFGEGTDLAFSSDHRRVAWMGGAEPGSILNVAAMNTTRHGVGKSLARLRLEHPGNKEEVTIARGERRTIEWRSDDGTPVSGLVVLPTKYDPDKRYPLITAIHGGPFGVRGDRAAIPLPGALMFDYWAGKGYAILAPNYRSDGSAGWSAILKARESGETFDRDLEDIMSGVDEVIRLGIADADRVAIVGHSFGSTIVNWAITHTRRFRVAVSYEGSAGIDWARRGLTVGYAEWLYGGSPLEKQDAYDRQSALRSARGVKTPTLFVAGEYGNATEQLQWLYTALVAQNVPSAFILYRGEGHNMESPANKRDVIERVTRWIEKHIGDEHT